MEEDLQEFSETMHKAIETIWETLPASQRAELRQVLKTLPRSLKPLKEILALVLDQYSPLIGTKRSIAIVGPANVGKSTLYNHLISRKEDEAAVSAVPGTTRTTQIADAGVFTLIDTPGADAVGEVGERERQIAFEAATQADFLVIVFESTRGITRYEKKLFDDLKALDKLHIIVLNKMDLVPEKNHETIIKMAAQNLQLDTSQIIDTVATKGENVGRIVLAIAKLEPRLLMAIGQALPEYRAKLGWQRTISAAGAAAIIGLTPLPLADMVPLLAIQSGLVLSIARIYGYRITLNRAKELAATFGLGFLGRMLFQQLSKLGGAPGWALSAGIAASVTVAMGFTAMTWFTHGERPTQDAIKKITLEITDYLKKQLVVIGKQKPDRATLRARTIEALKKLPIAQSIPPGSKSNNEAEENTPDLEMGNPSEDADIHPGKAPSDEQGIGAS